jgi:hypothetical protein
MSFVGHRQVNSGSELETLIKHYGGQSQSYYFLRWPHCVSGIISELPEAFSSAEGQLFNAMIELRWKRRGNGYSVLLLSSSLDSADGFTAIPGDWEISDRTAYFYGKDDARFPKSFTYPDHLSIYQRYFLDTKTSTVHFVALTISE